MSDPPPPPSAWAEARWSLTAADEQGRNMRWHAAEHHREVGAAWATLAVAESIGRLADLIDEAGQ